MAFPSKDGFSRLLRSEIDLAHGKSIRVCQEQHSKRPAHGILTEGVKINATVVALSVPNNGKFARIVCAREAARKLGAVLYVWSKSVAWCYQGSFSPCSQKPSNRRPRLTHKSLELV